MNREEKDFLDETFAKMKAFMPVGKKVPNFHPRLRVEMKEDMPDFLKSAWDLAVFEAEANIQPCSYGGEYFTAGGRGGW